MNLPLLGTDVVAIGLRYDRLGEGVRLLAGAGARVAALDLGDLDDEPLSDDVSLLGEAPTDGAPSTFLIEHVGGSKVRDLLHDGEHEAVWREALRLVGHPKVLYLGRWNGFVDYGAGDALMRLLGGCGPGEVIATEADGDSDHTLRWMTRWARAHGKQISLAVLREPSTGIVGDPEVARTPTAAWEVLVRHGWQGPLSIADADRRASERRQSGDDVLAGRLWRYVETGDVDSGCCAVGDAAGLAGHEGFEWSALFDREALDLQVHGIPLLAVRNP